jgi:hypothetical protein
MAGDELIYVHLAKAESRAKFDGPNAGIAARCVVADPTFGDAQARRNLARRAESLVGADLRNEIAAHRARAKFRGMIHGESSVEEKPVSDGRLRENSL